MENERTTIVVIAFVVVVEEEGTGGVVGVVLATVCFSICVVVGFAIIQLLDEAGG